ncbi:hypothetical protein TWF694_000317 [Orbilia ellipsospora]|uniref:Uncharacterized protein n=1 Tax=Orbilia ellipsospora TaxID=2528407 RepID=A0AAV9XUW6_9PEZI
MRYLNYFPIVVVFQEVFSRLLDVFHEFDKDQHFGASYPPLRTTTCRLNYEIVDTAAVGQYAPSWGDIFYEWVEQTLKASETKMQAWQQTTVQNYQATLLTAFPPANPLMLPQYWNFDNFLTHATTSNNPTLDVLSPRRFVFNQQL